MARDRRTIVGRAVSCRGLALIIVLALSGAHGVGQQSKVIELKSANKLEGRTINNEEVRELTGNVHFTQPTRTGEIVKVWCDRALRYMNQNKIELYGKVRIVRDSATITSDEGVYFANTHRATVKNNVRLVRGQAVLTSQQGEYFVDEKRSYFSGDVLLVDPTSIITCAALTYFENEARSVATGNVKAFQPVNSTTVFGDSLLHFERQRFTVARSNPRMMKIDTSTAGVIDTLIVVSKVMESYQDSVERFIAIDSVRMARSDLAGRCGRATYYVQQDLIILQNQPVVWQGENQITGDSMAVRLHENALRSVFVKGRAMAISRADSIRRKRFDQLTGRELTMFFFRNKVERVEVQRNATSLYYLFDNDRPNGINKSSGDRIFIEFLDGKVDRIKIVGGVQGQYLPERMINRKEQEYNLDGFRWYTERPKRIQLQIVSERHE